MPREHIKFLTKRTKPEQKSLGKCAGPAYGQKTEPASVGELVDGLLKLIMGKL
jgi:hypothetical protein